MFRVGLKAKVIILIQYEGILDGRGKSLVDVAIRMQRLFGFFYD